MKQILNLFYGENIGGIEKNMEYLSQIFNILNFDSHFLSISNKKNNLKLNGKVSTLNENIHVNIFLKIYRPFLRGYKIKQYCKKNNILFSISHGDSINISNIISKLFFGNTSQIVITINNSLEVYNESFFGKILLFLMKKLYNRSNKIIFISEELKIEYIKKIPLGKEKIFTIYNPINIDQINLPGNIIEKDLFKKNIKSYIHIARLESIKNQIFIINGFSIFLKTNPNNQLIIIGEGTLLNQLISEVKNLGIDKKIFFIGYKENIYDYLKKSDYFIFASKSEGFGRSLIESIGSGTPILTHDFKYGAKEIIRNNDNMSSCIKIEVHENGILIPYGDKESFVTGLSLLQETNWNKNKICSNAKKFDLQSISQKWDEILK